MSTLPSVEEVERMTVKGLQAALTTAGVSYSGLKRKAQFKELLLEHIAKQNGGDGGDGEGAKDAEDSGPAPMEEDKEDEASQAGAAAGAAASAAQEEASGDRKKQVKRKLSETETVEAVSGAAASGSAPEPAQGEEEGRSAKRQKREASPDKPETNDDADVAMEDAEVSGSSLRVDGLRRPFRAEQLEELLAEYGPTTKFWMNNVQSHCYVTFETAAAAAQAAKGLSGKVWPKASTTSLATTRVPDADVVAAMTQPAEPVAPKVVEVAKEPEKPKEVDQPDELMVGEDEWDPAELPDEVDLDAHFRKTETTPHLYWLPLTDEEATAHQEAKTRPRGGGGGRRGRNRNSRRWRPTVVKRRDSRYSGRRYRD